MATEDIFSRQGIKQFVLLTIICSKVKILIRRLMIASKPSTLYRSAFSVPGRNVSLSVEQKMTASMALANLRAEPQQSFPPPEPPRSAQVVAY